MIGADDFAKVDMRVGRVVAARVNPKARKPAYVLTIDFGEELGVKTSSAQITDHYACEQLIGRQVIGVVNLPKLRIADVTSEVLVLGALTESGVVLLRPDSAVANGARIA